MSNEWVAAPAHTLLPGDLLGVDGTEHVVTGITQRGSLVRVSLHNAHPEHYGAGALPVRRPRP